MTPIVVARPTLKTGNVADTFPKETWYRMPEREMVKTPIKHLAEGTMIKFSRVIVRCGYEWQPLDMPLEETNRRAIKKLAETMALSENTVIAMVEFLEDPWLMDESLRARHIYLDGRKIEFNPGRPHWALRKVYHAIRGNWLATKQREADRDNVGGSRFRTLWYVDLPGEGSWGMVQRTVTRKIGEYYAPRQGYGEYGGEGDGWEPGGIATRISQPVYEIFAYWQPGPSPSLHVHPLDVLEAKSQDGNH